MFARNIGIELPGGKADGNTVIMEWFYANGGDRMGPIDAKQFETLIRDAVINGSTLVWSAGMAEWKPWAQVAGDTAVCAASGGRYWLRDMVPYEGKYISAEKKAEYFQRLNQGTVLPGESRYAGFWIRFVAKFIDGCATSVVSVMLNVCLFFLFFGSFLFGGQPPMTSSADMGKFFAYQGLSILVNVGVSLLYQWFFLSRFAATPGKMVFSLKVVRADGSPLTNGRIIGRFFAELISYVIFSIGYIMAGFDEQKRTLHDRICDTRVIKTK